jgi:hypothetical protein
MTEYKAYCDESGNTGARFYDLEQPVYVLASWLVPAEVIPMAEAAINQLRQNYYPDSSELHGTRLLSSARGID